MDVLLLVVLALLFGLLPGWIASRKGHSFALWWGLGSLLFIVALPVTLLMPDATRRRCPFCAEKIRVEAKVCPHCQRELSREVKDEHDYSGVRS